MDPAGQLPQLVDRLGGLARRPHRAVRGARGDRRRRRPSPRLLQRQHHPDEPLLGAVVQVPLEASALLLGRRHDPLRAIR